MLDLTLIRNKFFLGLIQIRNIKQFVATLVYGPFIHLLGLIVKDLSRECTNYTSHVSQNLFHLH